ncbi:MAG: ATP-binding cassette domain-containing protein [Acidobacteria bacterium]|nr:ATP-binding cassette domain-containing protein [Acidobacteriota bacterium]
MSVPVPAIEFRNVSISFDDVRALNQVSFTLGQGEMICITGDSQSGKSVLLRLAMGFLQPDEGEVWINGANITGLDETDLLSVRRGLMGMVFQENALFTGQSVFENAAYRLTDQEWPEDKIERAVVEVLSFVGLQNELEKQAEELSGGMKRRLELARALIGWPKIMLYDEPTAGLDPINAYQVMDLVIRARDLHGISSLYVTKMLHEISYLANHRAQLDQQGSSVTPSKSLVGTKVMLLEEGRIAFSGSPQEFETSALPAVQHMLHPMTEAMHDDMEFDDPWAQNRRNRSKHL